MGEGFDGDGHSPRAPPRPASTTGSFAERACAAALGVLPPLVHTGSEASIGWGARRLLHSLRTRYVHPRSRNSSEPQGDRQTGGSRPEGVKSRAALRDAVQSGD